jgi:5-methyltetrahydrofolate--homocysteine methyltransferase
MAGKSIAEELRGGGVLVSDGAWGTFLYAKGLAKGACPELWCAERPDDVRDIAASYLSAGADLVGTNSFGGTRFRLAIHGLADRASELNEAAARLSREAAGGSARVLGTMGPTGAALDPEGGAPDGAGSRAGQMREAFAEQALALARGGADALCVETMSDEREAAIAVRAAKEATGLEVICTFTFARRAGGLIRTTRGLSPLEAAEAALEAGADIVGANCGTGSDGMVEIAREMRRAAGGAPILLQPSAGLPAGAGGAELYPEGPAAMAALVPLLLAEGVSAIGGCCGTTPEHIAAIRKAVDAFRKAR